MGRCESVFGFNGACTINIALLLLTIPHAAFSVSPFLLPSPVISLPALRGIQKDRSGIAEGDRPNVPTLPRRRPSLGLDRVHVPPQPITR